MSNLRRETFRAWAQAMLAHHHGVSRGSHRPAEVYQTSTMAALLDGIYDGEVTIADLLTHGDFGLGTFNRLDGEMVVLDGICYHLRSDGSASVAAGRDLTPFAVVTWFEPRIVFSVSSPINRDDLVAKLDETISSTNLIHAIRVTGTFRHVRTRTVMAQTPPYPPLTEATADEPFADFHDVTGTLAGFRTPGYEQGISVAGYHLHFLDEGRTRGGHALDFELTQGEVAVGTSSEIHLSLPTTAAFLAANLSRDDVATQIKQTEGG
jgi:acetolactate decarboxylase